MKDSELISDRSTISRKSIISRKSVRKSELGNKSANNKIKMLKFSAKTYEKGLKSVRREQRAVDLNKTLPVI